MKPERLKRRMDVERLISSGYTLREIASLTGYSVTGIWKIRAQRDGNKRRKRRKSAYSIPVNITEVEYIATCENRIFIGGE
jgi:hypothetical protein